MRKHFSFSCMTRTTIHHGKIAERKINTYQLFSNRSTSIHGWINKLHAERKHWQTGNMEGKFPPPRPEPWQEIRPSGGCGSLPTTIPLILSFDQKALFTKHQTASVPKGRDSLFFGSGARRADQRVNWMWWHHKNKPSQRVEFACRSFHRGLRTHFTLTSSPATPNTWGMSHLGNNTRPTLLYTVHWKEQDWVERKWWFISTVTSIIYIYIKGAVQNSGFIGIISQWASEPVSRSSVENHLSQSSSSVFFHRCALLAMS